jgi:hypothetical protein
LNKDYLQENVSMRRNRWIAAALLGLGYTVLPIIPAFAGYGAFAWDRGAGKYGASWNQQSPLLAMKAAIRDCGASRCRVVSTLGPRICGALATTEDGRHAGAAKRKDRATARLAALKNCEKNNAGACIVRAADCNK